MHINADEPITVTTSLVLQTYRRPKELANTLKPILNEDTPSSRGAQDAALNEKLWPDLDYKYQALLLSDDDVYYQPKDLEFVFQSWRKFGRIRLVEALARCYLIDASGDREYIICTNRKGRDDYTMILTNLTFSLISFLDYYSPNDAVVDRVREYVDQDFNCEDIAFSYVHSLLTVEGPLLISGHDIYVNLAPSQGISRKKGHMKARSQYVTDFSENFGFIAAPRDVTSINLAPSPNSQHHISKNLPHLPQKPATMPDQGEQTGVIISTAIVALITGYAFGVFTTRGYLISPDLAEERRRNLHDPVESDESEIDEDDSLLDHAPNWTNGADADQKQGLRNRMKEKAPIVEEKTPVVQDNGEECKLVLVVRTDLGMTKGKIAAQCSHATLACYKTLSHAPADSPQRKLLKRWERLGQAKIAVQVKSQDEILELRRKARSLGLTAEVIQDAGRTQIEAGSMTVLGVGPAPRSIVDQITGGLKLL
ncbi:hypothetical protein FZEAL_7136 [Fusarium zealandicum]|uniref:peptidyl-tRNA hydrolase n=1 Tax=Fusarium zealandicum TaxID=1053134 RepID=A0A8H4UH87_9HYPO|nr:hypothetical protein FZEAL_7136 [Fusarium zealandicum]